MLHWNTPQSKHISIKPSIIAQYKPIQPATELTNTSPRARAGDRPSPKIARAAAIANPKTTPATSGVAPVTHPHSSPANVKPAITAILRRREGMTYLYDGRLVLLRKVRCSR